MATLSPRPKFQAFDNTALRLPLAWGNLYTYAAGTTTPKTTWKDEAKSQTNTNPVILDTNGYADVWLDGAYKLVLNDSDDNNIWTVDNIEAYDQLDWTGLTATIVMLNATDTSGVQKNGNYVVLQPDRGKILLVDDSGADATVTLPAAAAINNGFQLHIKKDVISTNQVIVAPPAGLSINGFAGNITLPHYNDTAHLLFDGNNYNVVSENRRRRFIALTGDLTPDLSYDKAILMGSIGAAAVTVTLPPIAEVGAGYEVVIKLIATAGGSITVNPPATKTIDGAANYLFEALNETITFVLYTDGNYYIIESHNPTAYLPTAFIAPYGAATLPAGWLACNGAAVSRTTYADLFAIIGVAFGAGDGATTFNVPQIQDNVVVGSGGSYAIAETFGLAAVTLVLAQMPSHRHHVDTTNILHQDNTSGSTPGASWNGIPGESYTDYQGNDVAHENRPPSICIPWMIKY